MSGDTANGGDLQVAPGREVVLRCRIEFEDGRVAEETAPSDPLCIHIGDGTLLERLEQRLHGLHAGDRRAWTLPPDEAFGHRDPENLRDLPRDHFGEMHAPQPGQIVSFALPDGSEVPGTVIAVADDAVRVDFNHPFAGHTIRFEVEIVAVAETA